MEPITIIFIIATLLCGAATLLVRKPQSGACLLAVVLSVCSIAAIFEDPSMSEDLIMIVLMPIVAVCFLGLGLLITLWRG